MAVTLHRSRAAPWAALVAAAVAEALNQQLLSDMLRFDCRLGVPVTGAVVGLLTLALVALGAWISWRSTDVRAEESRTASGSTRRFVAHLGLLFAALLSVAIVWQVLATLLVSPCPD